MPNPSRSLNASNEHQGTGPDYFGYYAHEVVNLLSQDENDLQSTSQTPEHSHKSSRQDNGKITGEHKDSSASLSNDDSYFKKERLRSIIRQSATNLSFEVDEMLEPVCAMQRLRSRLKGEDHISTHGGTRVPERENGKNVAVPYKKQKGDGDQSGSNKSGRQKKEVNDDLHFLLESDPVLVDEIVKKHADQLSGKLEYMEQQMELILNAVTSTCSLMTHDEIRQLQKQIQKLPPRNLDRVVEIISQGKPVEEKPSDEFQVDLEKEDNITLWRLHYYVKSVERARSLASSQKLD